MMEPPETLQRGLWGVTTLVCAALFLWLAVPAKTHGVFPWERELAAAITAWDGPWLDLAMRGLSSLTQAMVVGPAVVVVAFLRRRRWGSFAWFAAIVVVAAPLVAEGLKSWVARPSPAGLAYGFPSGHAFMVSVAVGIALPRLWSGTRSLIVCAVWALAGAALVGATAVSRIYLAAHWPLDVIGGALAGGAYVAGAIWLFHRVSRFARGRWP